MMEDYLTASTDSGDFGERYPRHSWELEVEQSAQKAGIKMKRITPRRTSGGRRPGKHFRSVTLEVKIETSPPSLINMLAALEGGEYLLRIDSLQIRRDIKKGDKIDATFEVVGLSLPPSFDR